MLRSQHKFSKRMFLSLTRSNLLLWHSHKSTLHSSAHLYNQKEEMSEMSEMSEMGKIDFIVDEIAKLNLFQVSQLVHTLKTKLNLPDTALMGTATPMNNVSVTDTSVADAVEAEPEITQTIFDITLKAYPTDKKVSIIKEVRALYKLGLKEAKALVEKAPCTLQAQAPKVEAEEVKLLLESVGADISLD